MKTPKCKHNVTLDSECADCIEIKTDNVKVVHGVEYDAITQPQKWIDGLVEQYAPRSHDIDVALQNMGLRIKWLEGNPVIKTDNSQVVINQAKKIAELELKLDEQIACISKLERFSYSCLRSYVWDCELDGGDVQDWAVTAGLVKECAYDSKIHHNVTSTEDMEDGDTFFLIVDPIANGESLKQVKADAIREVASDLYDYDIHSDHDAYHACINISKQLLKEGE